MLTDAALKYLRPLKFNPRAERLSCMIPMGGIYWSDEIPDFRALMDLPDSELKQIYRLFAIRFRLWAGEALTDDDQSYWDAAQQLVPDYPLFHRVRISDDDRAAQEATEQETIAGFEALFGGADEVKIDEDGSFSATFDLTKEEPPSRWQRILGWLRLS